MALRRLVATAAMIWGVWGFAQWASAQQASLDELLKDLPRYKTGDSRRSLERIAEIVVKVQPDQALRAPVAARLAGLLGQEGTYECKDFICRQLYLIGGKAEIPEVAKLLADEQLSHMARYVLEAMADPDADAAMREALGKTKGKVQVGIINSLGARRDIKSVAALVGILNGDEAASAVASAGALGKIGGDDALRALVAKKGQVSPELRAAVIDSCLLCADDLLRRDRKADATAVYVELSADRQPARVRIAALRGLASAAPDRAMAMIVDLLANEEDAAMQALAAGVARQLPGDQATNTLAAAMPKLKTNGQVLLLGVLGDRGASARIAVLAAVGSAVPEVRLAALRAAAVVGDASTVPVLVNVAAKSSGQEKAAARDALARLRGADVDAAVVAGLGKDDVAAQVELVRAVTARRTSAAVQPLFALARTGQEGIRIASIEALGTLSEEKDYPALAALYNEARTDGEKEAVRDALSTAGARMTSRDGAADILWAAMKDDAGRAALVRVLPRVNGTRSLNAVRMLLESDSAAVRQAAGRAIAEWPDAAAIEDMLALTRSDDRTLKILSLRGLVRVMALPGGPAGAEAVAAYRQMLAVAPGANEKRTVLGGLGDVKHAAALDLALAQLADEQVRADAAMAVIKIARNVIGSDAVAAKAALGKVIDAKINETVTGQAQELLAMGK